MNILRSLRYRPDKAGFAQYFYGITDALNQATLFPATVAAPRRRFTVSSLYGRLCTRSDSRNMETFRLMEQSG